jgi:hypothetical protein
MKYEMGAESPPYSDRWVKGIEAAVSYLLSAWQTGNNG